MSTTTSGKLNAPSLADRWAKPPFGRRTLTILFAAASFILGAYTVIKPMIGHGHGWGDYPTWYAAGQMVLHGGDLYKVAPGEALWFIYPPFAALLMAPLALFGVEMMIFLMVLASIASWWISIRLSEGLSGVAGAKVWLVAALPSLILLPFLYELFTLGQPNLVLLALMLMGLALLQWKHGGSAGAMFAAATALKAFPVAVLPYLLWRRHWKAAASMVLCTAAFLVIVPAPFRGFTRNLRELKTWSQGMVFSANEKGFGQRPEQNWGWRNQSIIAVTHRFLRPLNSEGQDPENKPIYVNVADLTYQQANLALLAVATLIGLGFIMALPPDRRRTAASDGAEFALLIALMTVASPLSRYYYFVWLLFPYTVLIDRAVADPQPRVRRITWWMIALSLVLFTVGGGFVTPRWPQALGNSLWATAVLMGLLVWHMRRDAKPALAGAK